ncbi:MAG: hypothetical protein KKG99_02405 [Bacteroidetes bacterium]|nr:hypothetical protein [Bacteroidota bacterium]
MVDQNEIINTEGKKRPEALTIICILTFIGSGLAAFSNLIIHLSFDMLLETYESGGLNLPGAEIVFTYSKSFYLLSFFLYSFSLYGAMLMWRLKKFGFHTYAIAQILLLIIPSLYVKTEQFPLFGVLLTTTFILFYFRHLKFMN